MVIVDSATISFRNALSCQDMIIKQHHDINSKNSPFQLQLPYGQVKKG